jgi:glucosylceramidase
VTGSNSNIRWITTTESAPWVEKTAPGLTEVTSMPGAFIDLDNPKQTVEGFGASFNEFGWDALQVLPEADRTAILRDFFEPGVGLNFNLCRMPVGANDFSRDWYSYDEVDGDFELDHFSIENDLDTLVPFVKAAKQHAPNLALWASPWSPPTWMKTNKHYAGGIPNPVFTDVQNGLTEEQVLLEGTDGFIQEDHYLTAYAKYFGRFIDAYAEQGIRIQMVMPQNEFNSAQIFPSCTWTPDGLARFTRALAPEMAKRDVEIFLGTLERGDEGLFEGVVADPVAAAAIKGVGIQWAGKGAVTFIHRKHPNLRIYQTEQECGDGLNDWRYARHAWDLMKRYFTNGAAAYMYWNMALLEGGISRWGWAQNSLVVVDREKKTFRFSHEYYLLKHVSHFVQPGARALSTASYTGFENQIAFQNPDGGLVMVVQNDTGVEQDYSALVEGKLLRVTLPADSFNTFVVPGN